MIQRSDTSRSLEWLHAAALALAILIVAAGFPSSAGAHDLKNSEDPNVAGDSAAHARADAVNVTSASRDRKMMKRLNRIAAARAKKRVALGLSAAPVQVSDQGIRQRGFMQIMGFDVSLTAPNLLNLTENAAATQAPTAAASSMASSGAYSASGPSTLANENVNGLWGPVIWPIYQVKPGDPDYSPVANANPTPTGSGSTPSPPGNSGDTPAAPGSANNPNPRIVPVFEALMPDGKVLYWDWLISGWFKDGTDTQSTRILLWDPLHPEQPGERLDVANANLFCAGFAHLPNGDLFLAGGNENNEFHGLNKTYIYHWRTKAWEQGPDMSRLRWYPSVASMYNGEQMILGGDPPGGYGNPAQTSDPATRAVPEVYSAKYTSAATQQFDNSNDTIKQLDSIRFGNDASGPGGSDAINPPSSRGYPFLVPSVDGRVLYGGYESETYLVDSTGAGASAPYGQHDPFWRINGSFVNYNIGKVLLFGGGASAKYGPACDADELVGEANCTKTANEENGVSKRPTYIDLLNQNWTEGQQGLPGRGDLQYPHTSNDMNFKRRFEYSTVLPDGDVLITGGMSSTDHDDGDNAADDDFNNNLVNLPAAVKAAELFNPGSETFTTLSSAAIAREYHSTALLLPDATVLTGGGGVCGPCTTQGNHYYNPNFEIFKPPYLFNSDGTEAIRPSITTPTHSDGGAQMLPPVDYNKGFQISYTPGKDQNGNDGHVSTAALLKLGTPTHSTDTGQRFIPLDFLSEDTANRTLTLRAPLNSYIAPPGYYMLFVVDDHGTPSISKMVQVGARLALNNKSSTVRVFRNAAFAGTAQYLGLGEYTQSYGNFANVGNNGISSIQVDPGYQAQVCKDAEGTQCVTYTTSQSSLSGAGFDENISYVKVTLAGGGDVTAPTVAISSPVDGSTVASPSAVLQFSATDASGVPTCNRASGEAINFKLGLNKISVSCFDSEYNVKVATVNVTYQPQEDPTAAIPATPPPPKPVIKLASSLKLASSFSLTAKCTTKCWAEAWVKYGRKKFNLKGANFNAALSMKKLTFRLSAKQLKILKIAKKKRQKISFNVRLFDSSDQSTSASSKIK